MKRRRLFFILSFFNIFIVFFYSLNAIQINQNGTKEVLKIDGIINENSWQVLGSKEKFFTIQPENGKIPSENTEVFITYSKDTLYLAAICYYKNPKMIKTSISNRDAIERDDWIRFEIDSQNDQQKNYAFGVNAHGIQYDGILDRYGELDLSQDFVWKSKGRITNIGYTVELAIPFNNLRFNNTKNVKISIGSRRYISRYSEVVSFPKFNPSKGSILLQRETIELNNIITKKSIDIIPHWVYLKRKFNQQELWETDSKYGEFGLDLKYGISSDLTLDVTCNPDFSHVESDVGRVDINLRHSLFYPEKRLFFLEGKGELQFGGQKSGSKIPLKEIVNTRNIVDPELGIKITGKLGRNHSLYTLYALDEYNSEDKIFKTHFTIFRYKMLLKNDGFLGGIYTNKINKEIKNHLLGFDGRFRLSGTSTLEYFAFKSILELYDVEEVKNSSLEGSAFGLKYEHITKIFNITAGLYNYSDNFYPEVGYMTRNGLFTIRQKIVYSIYPESKIFQRLDILHSGYHFFDKRSGLHEFQNWTGFYLYLPKDTQIWVAGYPFSTEVYQNSEFSISGYEAGVRSQILKYLYFNFTFFHKNKIFYDKDNPYQGCGNDLTFGLILQLNSKFNSNFDMTFSDFYKKNTDQNIYNFTIIRNKSMFQINKYFFLRSIVEYNSYYKKITCDFLASYTYMPGTVIQIGYGSVWDKNLSEIEKSNFSEHYINKERSFFIKMSYRLRI